MAKDLIPSLNFKSSVEALAYYELVFAADKIGRMAMTSDLAENFGLAKSDPNLSNYTVHGSMRIFDLPIYFNDIFDEHAPIQNPTLVLAATNDDLETVEALEALWKKVVASDKVTVKIPYGPQFWGGRLGLLTDKFNISWQFAVNEQI